MKLKEDEYLLSERSKILKKEFNKEERMKGCYQELRLLEEDIRKERELNK